MANTAEDNKLLVLNRCGWSRMVGDGFVVSRTVKTVHVTFFFCVIFLHGRQQCSKWKTTRSEPQCSALTGSLWHRHLVWRHLGQGHEHVHLVTNRQEHGLVHGVLVGVVAAETLEGGVQVAAVQRQLEVLRVGGREAVGMV